MFRYWNDIEGVSEAFSFQLVWLFSEVANGGGDFNEIHRAARNIRPGNRDDWHNEFRQQGERLKQVAEEALSKGYDATAGSTLLRACTYFRSAEHVLPSHDERKPATYNLVVECFRRGLTLSLQPYEVINIPFDGHLLEGYFFPPRERITRRPPPCVVFVGGADSLPEGNYFRGVQHITARGAACLAFNGPGQGSTLRRLKLPTIPDYERPISAVLDYVAGRQDIDHDSVGVIGVSFGGYYAPRAACFEHRIKACVAWGALYDILNDIYLHYPPLRPQLNWIVGARSDDEAMAKYASFSLAGLLDRVRCPVLVTHGANDRMVPLSSAERLFRELTVADKEIRIYTSEEGGAEHCSTDNWSQAIPFQIDWLLDRLNGGAAMRQAGRQQQAAAGPAHKSASRG